jgi:hypothetical protein
MYTKTRLSVWLADKNKNYVEGVAIYKELAVNPERIRFFSTPVPGKMHENMLHSDLRRYARLNNITPRKASVVQKKVAKEKAVFEKIIKKQGKFLAAKPLAEPGKHPETARVRVLNNPKVNYDELPQNLQRVYDQFEGLYRDYEDKRARLIDLPKEASHNPQRKQLAGEIVALKKTIMANWQEIDSWWENRKESKKPVVVKPSGKMSKAEIERLADPEVKALSKRMRIEANLKYLARNHGSAVAKTKKQMEERKQELEQWGVDYAETLAKNS